jgi:hypothetical protein
MAAIPYDARMALLWTILIAGVALGLIAAVLLSWRQYRSSSLASIILVGGASGLAGAAVILGPRMDLVPDELERLGALVLVMLGSLGLIIATWLRSTRH